MLTELDLTLVNALQVDPRAPWSVVGSTLGIGAVTAARRWEQLVARGEAWMTAYPAGDLADRLSLALVQVDCAPGMAGQVAEKLATEPHVPTVEYVAGPCDLLIHVVAPELAMVSDFVVNRLATLPGVVRTRTMMSPRLFSEGSRWQVHAISPSQREALVPRTPQPGAAIRFGELDRSLVLALGENGRASHAELADRLEVSASTVRRHLDALLGGGSVRLRCEIARSKSPAPVTMMLWLRVPPDRLETTARSLAILPEVRMCAALTGAANLLLVVWLRSPADAVGLESLMVTKLSWVEIADRAVTLRSIKLMGSILDETGHANGRVPLDFWSPV
jgi:DNA-binding Lrp family transcriptional regulator